MSQPKRALPALFGLSLLALSLGACRQGRDDSNIAIDNGANVPAAAVETVSGSGQRDAPVGPDVAPTHAQTPAATIIPAQYRGRWGMVPADCTTTRGDAKGLITIGETSFRLYESTATLKTQRPAIATSFSGSYVVTGEGQSRDQIITLTRSGDRLRRADDAGRSTYRRCA